MFTAVNIKTITSDMCTLVGRCLSFGPAASTIRAAVADQTGTLLFYTGQRWSGTEIQTGQWKPRPRKGPSFPFLLLHSQDYFLTFTLFLIPPHHYITFDPH